MSNQLPNFTYINDTEQFRWLAVELANEPLLAIDTESNSMHAYRGEICLVQLSTRKRDFIIDVLAVEDLSPLGALMESSHIEIVFHAAEYDLMLFRRDYGFGVNHLFDTMVAARVLGYQYHGLANMMKHYFDIHLDKSHQRDDWGTRPLPQDSLRYAQMDTHFLPRLRDILEQELIDMGRLAEAQELFEEAEVVPAADDVYDPDGFWKIGRAKRLKKQEMAILREVFLLREVLAQKQNVPVFKIMSNSLLVNIARSAPHSMSQLNAVKSMSPVVVRRFGEQILGAIKQGKNSKLPPPPPAPRPPPHDVLDRYNDLQVWRKQTGEARGVESDVVMTKTLMWRIARTIPQTLDELSRIDGLGPQRIAMYGDALLALMAPYVDDRDEY